MKRHINKEMEKITHAPDELKQVIRESQRGCCDCCGDFHGSHLQIHHKVPRIIGEQKHVPGFLINSRFNLVGLCPENKRREPSRDCHDDYDKKAFNEGIVYPGEPIDRAIQGLFTIAVWHLITYYTHIYGKNKNNFI